MRRIFSVLLGAVLLLGGATLGLQANSASAAAHHDKNYQRNHHHHRHHHNRTHNYRKNKLSY